MQLDYSMARYEHSKLLYAQNLKDKAVLELKQSFKDDLLVSHYQNGMPLESKLEQANVILVKDYRTSQKECFWEF